jgi:hypothetical protein
MKRTHTKASSISLLVFVTRSTTIHPQQASHHFA